MADQLPPRRRFQFRLRTLLLLVSIVAVQCAVYLPALREWQKRRELERSIEGIRAVLEAWNPGGVQEGR